MLYLKVIGPDRFKCRNMFHFFVNYMTIDEEPTSPYAIEQLLLMKEIPKTMIKIMTLIAFSFAAVIIGPFYAYYYKNEHHIPSGLVLPFTNPDMLDGYMLNLSLQSCFAILAMLGTFGIEIMNILVYCTLKMMGKLLILEMKTLSNDVERNGFQFDHPLHLRNVYVRLQDIESYLDEYNSYSYWRCFFQPALTTTCVSLAIIGQYLNGWASGYGLAVSIFTQTMVLCYIGASIKNTCSHIVEEIYVMRWYNFPPKHRRHIQAMIHRWQHGLRLTIGPFGDISFETASDVNDLNLLKDPIKSKNFF